MKRISATDASRGFAGLLDRVERRGESYVVERRGRQVATIAPVRGASASGATVGDLLSALLSAPPIDGGFVKDMRLIRRKQGPPRDPWASSSTRHT
jgi:prevent-host-death family protein